MRLSPKCWAGIVLLAADLCFTTGCQTSKMPVSSSPEYNQVVRAFYVGVAALQVGDDVRADEKLTQLTQMVPDEPAIWANWGLLALRQRNFDTAAERLEHARSLDSANDKIYYLLGLLDSSRGRSSEAISSLRKAIELNPRNLVALYRLAREVERQSDENSEKEFQSLIQKILQIQPDNLAALLELGRIAAKRGDLETVRQTVSKISARSSGWPKEVQEQLTALQAAASGADQRATATRFTFLRNVLVRAPEYRQSLSAINPPPGEEAQPFTRFLRLESPTFSPAVADTTLTFTPQQITNMPGKWDWTGAISLTGEGPPAVVVANGHELKVGSGPTYPFPGGPLTTAPGPDGVLALDFNYDFKTDLVLAGAGGVRLMKQESASKFNDVTLPAKLPAAVTKASYSSAWAADIEADGDLDIVLGTNGPGSPTVLRNNGDGTFAELHPFPGVSGLRGFAWADLDADGDPDAALIDGQGKLRVFRNERSGQFQERPAPSDLAPLKTINVGDVNNDGIFDLVAVQTDGIIKRLSGKGAGEQWDTAEIARVTSPDFLDNQTRLRIADLDNNGGPDLVLLASDSPAISRGALIWLSDENGNFHSLDRMSGGLPPAPARAFDIADLNGDGKLDLLVLWSEGQPGQDVNHGSRNYHWQDIRPRAAQAVGDQRINSFGIGGDMEIRSGLLVQKQLITGPLIHFGLGDQPGADLVRIVWPNGSVRAEFDLKADQVVLAEQRLKGSCPFLFAYNGKEMKFVKDAVPWGSAIGLRINTIGTARVEATEEWYKVRGDQLVPHDGYYDVRITAELWETYYYDQLGLMVVDHPAGTEVFADERFVIPPAKPGITTVTSPHRIARAWDDRGTEVTDLVAKRDEKYLGTFGKGRYQGVTRDHYLELDLGDNVPDGGPLWLIAEGWMHPTDSSINVAISQGQNTPARSLSLEVADGHGGWVVVKSNLGFPAGREKICLFNLTNVFRPGAPRRLRLRTTLEVYWDCVQWAQGLANTKVKITRLDPDTADLHYRGYSVISQANESSPELPDYSHLSASKQQWRDLVGYYTRFGDIRELLARVDDRYVIMNAGDEMSFRFAAQPPPPAGWMRDYIVHGDGWIKDGDYNSTFSKTVLPLPYHAKQQYTTPPGKLEDEWVYRQHPNDWQTYQTRYVTPEVFQNALRTPAEQ